MDFDEYDYLEQAVEPSKEANGSEEIITTTQQKERRRSSRHTNDDENVSAELDHHKSKLSKSTDRSHDPDAADRNRGSSRRRSSPGDRQAVRREHRDKERDSGQHVKDRVRDGNQEKNDLVRSRDRDRNYDMDKRERRHGSRDERDKERERSGRSSSHSERHGDEQVPDKSLEVDYKDREREKEFKGGDRGHRRYDKEKKENGVEPEVDPERDQRTVFAYQISLKADERDVYDYFSRAGKVRDVRLIMDRNSRRSKGVGYVEFFDAMSVPMAIALSGQPLLGQPVMVKPSEAEKNLVQSIASTAGAAGGVTGPFSGGARKLYVGNLHFNMKEDQLRQVFESFGTVELVQLPTDNETGHCKGFGFVQFARLEDARAAQSLNGQLEIAGRIIKVSAVTDQVAMQDIGTNTGDLDDDEGGGLALNANSRALLMQKLDRSGSAPSIPGSAPIPAINSQGFALPAGSVLGAVPAVTPQMNPLLQVSIPTSVGLPGVGVPIPSITVPSVDSVGVPSECVLLKNMFDPSIDTEQDFDLDIKEDVQEECSKFGPLNHIYVDKHTAGFVYLRFENTQSAMNAQRALHGRWFAGKMISATFMVPQNYEEKFPESCSSSSR